MNKQSKIRISHPVKLRKILAVSVMLCLIAIACEDRYFPELDSKYNKVLVVEGTISNAPPPYSIKLSLSSAVHNPKDIGLSGYNIKILDNMGNEEELTESEPGTYISSSTGIQGTVGRKYKVLIHSPDGKTYSSDYEELKAPVGIESVYAEVEYEQSQSPPYEIPGYQFYIDTEMAQSDSTYLFWSMEETYKFESDYLIYYSYSNDRVLRTIYNSDTLKTCWKTGKAYPFFIESTTSLSEPRFTRYPLHFVNTKTRRLSIRYSLLVYQYTITEKAYQYWNGVKEQNTESGELYTRQPYQLRGNIFNIIDENELVLGYFMVASKVQERIFINKPPATVSMYYPVCELNQVDYELYGWMFVGPPPEWPLFVTENAAGQRALPEQTCIDCTLNGGMLEKPDFWTDF